MRLLLVTLLLFTVSTATLADDPAGKTKADAIGPRQFFVHFPKDYKADEARPLVLILHGVGQTPAQMEKHSGLSAKSDKEGFLAVYPAGKNTRWQAGKCCGTGSEHKDDITFLTAVLDKVIGELKVESDKVYVCGMSNGAMMAYRLAANMPDRFAAVAGVAGTRMSDKLPDTPIPMLHIHGKGDEIIKYTGGNIIGENVNALSVKAHIDSWVKKNKAKEVPTETSIPSANFTVKRFTHEAKDATGADVIQIDIHGGGHLWPGQPKPPKSEFRNPLVWSALGETPQDVSANDLIWTFFSK